MKGVLCCRCFITTCTVYSLACAASQDNSRFVLFTNKIALVLDLLVNRLNVSVDITTLCLGKFKTLPFE